MGTSESLKFEIRITQYESEIGGNGTDEAFHALTRPGIPQLE